MNAMKKLLAIGAIAAGVACGADPSDTRGTLQAPESKRTRMSLTPALDVSSVMAPELLSRVVIDEIVVSLSDVRLLGADPRVPAGGLPLAHGRLVSSADDGVSFPMPSNLNDELALFVQLAPSAELEGASVVVRARLFEEPQAGSALGLRAEPDPDGSPAKGGGSKAEPDPDGSPAKGGGNQEPDPDGSPAKGGGGKAEPDPDGSPALGGPRCEPDPDGSPALRRCRRQALSPAGYVAFELRGADTADLLVGLDDAFDVVVGIPAGRWLTPETLLQLEHALDEAPATREEAERGGADEAPLVVSATPRDMSAGSQPRDELPAHEGEDDYRLLGDDAAGEGLRKH